MDPHARSTQPRTEKGEGKYGNVSRPWAWQQLLWAHYLSDSVGDDHARKRAVLSKAFTPHTLQADGSPMLRARDVHARRRNDRASNSSCPRNGLFWHPSTVGRETDLSSGQNSTTKCALLRNTVASGSLITRHGTTYRLTVRSRRGPR